MNDEYVLIIHWNPYETSISYHDSYDDAFNKGDELRKNSLSLIEPEIAKIIVPPQQSEKAEVCSACDGYGWVGAYSSISSRGIKQIPCPNCKSDRLGVKQ